jgi:hypothetical protein
LINLSIQTSYCQSIEKIIDVYKESLKVCDSLNYQLKKDLKVCNNSDSTKSVLIKSHEKSNVVDNRLLDNRKEQINNNKEIILNQEQFKPKKSKPIVFGVVGVVVGYLLRKELESLISKL